jgi:cell division protease FtsH
MMEQKHFSEESAKEIDKEIRKILESCYKECQKLLRKYESKLHEIAKTLMDKEVVEYEEYAELVKDIIPKAKLKRA